MTNSSEFYFQQFVLFLKSIKIDHVTKLSHESRSFCQSCAVRNEDSRYEIGTQTHVVRKFTHAQLEILDNFYSDDVIVIGPKMENFPSDFTRVLFGEIP